MEPIYTQNDQGEIVLQTSEIVDVSSIRNELTSLQSQKEKLITSTNITLTDAVSKIDIQITILQVKLDAIYAQVPEVKPAE